MAMATPCDLTVILDNIYKTPQTRAALHPATCGHLSVTPRLMTRLIIHLSTRPPVLAVTSFLLRDR